MKPQIKNFAYTYLGTAMDTTQTTLRVKTGTGASFLTPDGTTEYGLVLVARSRGLIDLVQGELIRLDSVDGGDSDLYNVTRNYDSRLVRAHPAGELVLANIFAEHFDEFYTQNDLLQRFIALSFGNYSSAVIAATSDYSDLQVVPDSPTSMSVAIKAGHCIVNYILVRLAVDTVIGPISNTSSGKVRKDLVEITEDGVLKILTGNEVVSNPVAPTVDSDALALGVIDVDDAMVTIETGDITDARVSY